ncbi:PREDICTED: tyrosine-protein kinase BAZ1B-like [Priapulus caudatus]|uniref:Tyrosine-protein kinase BAZ1B-like n=1 Tax=Priapulus caudatus TaxID=37621 RepID=A0ABM1EEZ7_PRICU|nr:PREDICTED: tyrosine-protein kinase BAZ1B-like [Priapulus caudatus]
MSDIDWDEEDEDAVYCEACGAADREDRLLLCDACNLGYHLECLVPALEQVPTGDWFCHECVDACRVRSDRALDWTREDGRGESESEAGYAALRQCSVALRQCHTTGTTVRIDSSSSSSSNTSSCYVADSEEVESAGSRAASKSLSSDGDSTLTNASGDESSTPSTSSGRMSHDGEEEEEEEEEAEEEYILGRESLYRRRWRDFWVDTSSDSMVTMSLAWLHHVNKHSGIMCTAMVTMSLAW